MATLSLVLMFMFCNGGISPGSSSVAFAQSKKSRGTPTMREKVFEKLGKAAAFADEDNFSDALKQLKSAEKTRNLSSYEKVQLFTAYGYIYYSMDDFAGSIAAYEKVLLEEDLPDAVRVSTLYTVTQLLFQSEEYEKSIESLKRWMELATNPGPEAYLLLGQAYYQLERYREAVQPVEQAIATARSRGVPVKEKWYLLLRVFHYELKDHNKVLEVLELLLREYPRPEYWVQVASMYSELGDEKRQLASYEVAYLQGLLQQGKEIVLLAQLLMQADVPYRAGVVLSKGIEDELVEKTARNYRLLSQAWTAAQEDDKAIEALTAAAERSDDGEFDAFLAYAYSNTGAWSQSLEAAEKALTKGVDESDQLHLLTGQALFQLERYDEAKSAFARVKDPARAETVSSWIRHIETEQERLSALRRSLTP